MSGKKIYAKMEAASDLSAALVKLGNGALRSLVLYIHKAALYETEVGGHILGLAMCEVTTRFLAKGKDKAL